jgi:U3 small nucleolar RNA-associated protein 10
MFQNVLSIVPANKFTGEWKFLGPYHKDTVTVPRHAIVYAATHNDAFSSYFNNHTLWVCQEGAAHPQLLRFWSSVLLEATAGRLDQVKSGRREVQKQRTEDALLKILPLLNEGFELKGCPELTVVCFAVALVLAGNADLEDHVINSLMKAIAPFVTNGEADPKSALTCLAIFVTKKLDNRVPKDVLEIFMRANDLRARLFELHKEVPVASLCTALVSSAVSGLKEKNLDARLHFIENIFDAAGELFALPIKSQLVAILLRRVQLTDTSLSSESPLRTQLTRLLRVLNDSPDFSPSFSQAASLAGLSHSVVEHLLESTIESPLPPNLIESAPADLDDRGAESASAEDAVMAMMASFPAETTELSCLTPGRPPLFDQLAQVFTRCCRNERSLTQFQELPLWRQKSNASSALFVSFLLRMSLGPFSTTERCVALQALSNSLCHGSSIDTQSLIPYITVLLSDSAPHVRKAAAACVLVIQKSLSHNIQQEQEQHQNGNISYEALTMANVKRISPAQADKLLSQLYLPHLEEFVLDPSVMRKVVKAALDGHDRATPSKTKLKKTSKQALFDLLTGCALVCPLLKVKTGITELLIDVPKVGSATTNKTLSPILDSWASLSQADAEAAALSEGLAVPQIDAVVVQLVAPQDKEAVENILNMLAQGKFQPRSSLAAMIFDRIGAIWDDLRRESQNAVVVRLFEMSFSDNSTHAAGSRQVLHTVALTTGNLAAILDQSLSGLAQMPTDLPPKKRRRLSRSRESIPKELALEWNVSGARMTLALELVEDSKPENHPQLLGGLFEVLIGLTRLRDKTASESPYLLNLCLSSILAIVDKARQSRKPDIDVTTIRADLVTECVRSSENLQVQSTALLLSASLAALAPDRILHTIMPIFTFRGRSILSRDDERSIYVTNRAIDEIIPPLVASLKRQDAKNLVHSTSSLLSSFVTAYEHVPQHRRVSFYQRLLNKLGTDDFSFAVIALLASRRHSEGISTFLTSLTAESPVSTQILTFRKLLDLTTDIFSEKPHDAEPLLDITRTTPVAKRENEASILLEVAAQLLAPKALKTQVGRLSTLDGADDVPFWTEFKLCISRVLGMLKSQKTEHKSLAPSTKKCLSALLELPSLGDLLDLMPDFLDELEQSGHADLKPLTLRVLASQLHGPSPTSKDRKSQSSAISFLPTLGSIIKSTDDENLRHAAIECLDRIFELYGRKNSDAVVAATSALTDEDSQGLESKDERTQIMSLLCLTTATEVLKEGAVPIVLTAVPKVFRLFSSSLQDLKGMRGPKDGKVELHNACYMLLSSFIVHLHFMISEENLVEIFGTSYNSCIGMSQTMETCMGEARSTLEPPSSWKESRLELLNLVADKVELNSLVTSLRQAWQTNVITPSGRGQVDADAVGEWLDMLSKAIKRHSKSAVGRAAEDLSYFILQVLDLRRLNSVNALLRAGDATSQLLQPEKLRKIEHNVFNLSEALIYKLNDSTFRPIFEGWVEWARNKSLEDAAGGGDSDERSNLMNSARIARLSSLFSLASHFFESLKSIVTSYASYILPQCNEVLEAAIGDRDAQEAATLRLRPELDQQDQELYIGTLNLLSTIAKHDADGFFTSPSHFQPLTRLLIGQYELVASHKNAKSQSRAFTRSPIKDPILSTVVALATAVQDVPAHHHTLNHLLCQLRHHENAAVRLASIKTHISLTESEDVGEEWLQNVVLGQSSSTTEGGVAVGGSGETMVYVNEMLEDDDENVETSVREWVRMVRERVGEDIFEV